MTGEYVEFYWGIQFDFIEEFNWNENGEKKGKKWHLKEKISIIKRMFENLRGENSLTSSSNDTRICRILWRNERSSIEGWNRNEDGEKEHKKATFRSENLQSWQFQNFKGRKFREFEFTRQKKMQNFMGNSIRFDWRIQLKWRRRKKERKKRAFESSKDGGGFVQKMALIEN